MNAALKTLCGYLRKGGVVSLGILVLLLRYKKLREKYDDRNYPYLYEKIISFCSNISRYFGERAGLSVPYTFPDYSLIEAQSATPDASEIIEKCDLIVDNKLTMEFGYRIDRTTDDFWRKDPLNGNIYPSSMDRSIFKQKLPKHDGDIRLLWEINRLQFLVLLSQGYILTGNQTYIDTAIDIVESWVDQNQYTKGVNWLDAQEVGIRMVSILVSRSILMSSGVVDHRLDKWDTIIKQHAEFVFRHLSIGRVTHNHFMTELTSLFVFSAMITDYRHNYLWLYLSRYLLRREIKKTVE